MSRTLARAPRAVDKRAALLDWYDRFARDLPWRVGPKARLKGARADPYRVWLSEIMLQQTTVATVGPYFARFLELFPDERAMAEAPRDTLLSAWAGLGYYSRARNLHAAAQMLARDGFPEDEEGWRKLPGVGPYTAAAITAIAFDRAANVVDGNVERVMARLHAVEAPLPAAKQELRDLAADYVTDDRPGDWAQALMDLGATVCTPTSPKCILCPLREGCAGFASGAPETYPRKLKKAERPQRYGAVFVVARGAEVLAERRPDKGLLGGMLGLPTTPWRVEAFSEAEALALAPMKGKWAHIGVVRHVFTHFALTLDVYAREGAVKTNAEWAPPSSLPTVFKKAALLGLG